MNEEKPSAKQILKKMAENNRGWIVHEPYFRNPRIKNLEPKQYAYVQEGVFSVIGTPYYVFARDYNLGLEKNLRLSKQDKHLESSCDKRAILIDFDKLGYEAGKEFMIKWLFGEEGLDFIHKNFLGENNNVVSLYEKSGHFGIARTFYAKVDNSPQFGTGFNWRYSAGLWVCVEGEGK